jgi:type IV secretory pathway TraG/TraD family ATPase VirD4
MIASGFGCLSTERKEVMERCRDQHGVRAPPFDPNAPVCWLTDHDPLTLGQCCEGVLITGATGSGKTTGPADYVVRGLLRLGAGALWLCAKPGEYERALALARQTGRDQDVVRFAPGERWTMDVLSTEITAPGGSVESAAQLLDALLRLAQRSSMQGGDEPFWAALASRIIRTAITVLYAATGHASIADLDEVVASAPTTDEQFESDKFVRDSLCCRLIAHAGELDLPQAQKRDLAHAARFFLQEWRVLAPKTRSIGETMVRNVTSQFVTGELADLVSSGETNLPPESTQDGAIIVADMPALQFRELGQFFGMLLKGVVARATLRRAPTPDARPVMIVGDEFQLFCDAEQDAMTQTVARQSRLVTLAITQNLPSLYLAGGGNEKAKHAMDAFTGNLQTKFACSNSDTATNEFYSRMFGTHRELFFSGSTQTGDFDLVDDMLGLGSPKATASFSEQLQPCVHPHQFTTLRKGGPDFGYLVDAYVFQGGRVWSNGKNHVRSTFRQRF